MVLPSISSSAPSARLALPPPSLFHFTPSSNTAALSPPVSDHTLARPFNISPELYNNALHVSIPVTIALVYATTVTYFNRVNKERDYKPWAFSKSIIFYSLVVTHNAFLALYSGWTFIGMFNTIRKSWPGLDGEYGIAGAADALCKMHGPRGLGSAATYGVGSSGWSVTDRVIKLAGGSPDTTDVGRIWNEGLAFYGWLFYISKFYEIVDTAIILAKGKRSATLQTFHHTGAMMCLWAGVRYMSPPIWMFVFINSGIHTIMYTYYTLNSFMIQVPRPLKRVLTTLQIVQIVFGCSYALLHLFIAYDIPVKVPYLYTHNLSIALPSTASSLSSTISSALSSATATAGFSSWLKKAALRAAGEEGLAENVRNSQGEVFGVDAVHAADVEEAQKETRYRMETQQVHCLDTSGQVFAILLNAIYLVPLAFLFIRFFYKTYIKRSHAGPPKPSIQENIKESSKDAARNVEKEIQEAMRHEQGGATEPPPDTKEQIENFQRNFKTKASDLNEGAQSQAKDLGTKIKQEANDLSDKAKDATGDLPAKVQQAAQDGAAKVKDAASDIPAKAQEMGAQAKKAGKDTKQALADDLAALQEKMKKMGSERPKSSGKENTKLNGDEPRSSTKENTKLNGDEPKPSTKENTKPNGESKPRDKSPTKAPTPRSKSPVKVSMPRDKGPEKASKSRNQSPVKAPASREKSPVKASAPAPAPRAKSPEKPSKAEPSEETKEEQEEKKKQSSPDLGASGYEIVPDEPKTEEERKAEAEMQPKQE